MQFPFRDLTNQYISLSYQDVVQRYTQGTASYFLDGLGNVIVWLPTSSLGQQVITADQPVPFAVSASYALNGGSGGASTSSSWASHSFTSDTASYATSASYITMYVAYVTSASWASRSYSATTASYAQNAIFAVHCDVADLAETASFTQFAISAGNSATAHLADTASFTSLSQFAYHAEVADFTESSSYAAEADHALVADYALVPQLVTSSMANEEFSILFASSSGGAVPILQDADADLNYNPFLGRFSVPHIEATCVTASLKGTASWANDALMSDSASYALSSTFCDTASVAFESTFADTASLAFYSNYAGSSSYAFTASVALNVPQTASNALTASNLVGWNFTNTSSNVNILGSDIPVVEIATGSYNAAFFDYVALSGSNCRAGIVFGSWVNALINYTEVSNVDVGDTSKVTMSLALNGGNVQLLANVTDTTPWQVKALGRYL